MPDAANSPFHRLDRSDWLRLRTLVTLRWAAILGQIAAIWAAAAHFDLVLPMLACALAIGAAVLVNLVAIVAFAQNHRLSATEALLMLLFDLLQLVFLTFLTGGLTNPFALLILAPVMVGAAALDLRPALILGGLAVLLVSAIALWHVPLRFASGQVLTLPPVYGFGYWLAMVIGIVFLALYARRVALETHLMSDALLATQMALMREQKLTDLGGVVAAAAHELGTPLATIKLVSSELLRELADRPDLAEDARLIREQADRCRDILQGMGKAGKSDEMLRSAPVMALLREAAEPHLARGKEVAFALRGETLTEADQPQILRRPELIHGLRNLIQNAVDFASAKVLVEVSWDPQTLELRILDDGPGFPPQIINRIGDPFLRARGAGDAILSEARPGYQGMGLGLFIAKTLLERTGASLSFANRVDPFVGHDREGARSGALVQLRWPLEMISANSRGPLPRNPAIV